MEQREGSAAAGLHRLPRLRALGNLECYSAARYELGFYNNVGVTAVHRSPISQNAINEDNLRPYIYAACTRAIEEHSNLSAIPVRTTAQDVHFGLLSGINLDHCIQFHRRKQDRPADTGPDVELDKLLEAQHNTPFAQGEAVPVWRVVVLLDHVSTSAVSDFFVSFIFHHSIGDGSSALAFHRTFSHALSTSAPLLQTPSNMIQPRRETTLLPSLESALPLPLSPLYLLSAILASVLPSLFARRSATLWTAAPILPPTRTLFRSFALSRSTSAQLATMCRANNVSVTATILPLVATALLDVLPAAYEELRASCPVSLRRLIRERGGVDVTDDVIGVWYAGLETLYHRTLLLGDKEGRSDECGRTASLLREAQRTKEEMKHYLAKGDCDLSVGLLRWVSDMTGFFTEKIGSKREISLELSNLGVCRERPTVAQGVGKGPEAEQGGGDVGTDGSRIRRMVFSQSANVTGPAVTLSTVTGGDGCLMFGVTWQEGVVENSLVEKMIDRIRRMIDETLTASQGGVAKGVWR